MHHDTQHTLYRFLISAFQPAFHFWGLLSWRLSLICTYGHQNPRTVFIRYSLPNFPSQIRFVQPGNSFSSAKLVMSEDYYRPIWLPNLGFTFPAWFLSAGKIGGNSSLWQLWGLWLSSVWNSSKTLIMHIWSKGQLQFNCLQIISIRSSSGIQDAPNGSGDHVISSLSGLISWCAILQMRSNYNYLMHCK